MISGQPVIISPRSCSLSPPYADTDSGSGMGDFASHRSTNEDDEEDDEDEDADDEGDDDDDNDEDADDKVVEMVDGHQALSTESFIISHSPSL